MKAFLGAVALVLYWLAWPMHAFGEGWPHGVEPPPESYLTKTPAVPVFIHRVNDPNADCAAIYGQARDGWWWNGCTVLLPDEKRCDVYVPTAGYHGYGNTVIDLIVTHEVQGHCNGLRHDHWTGAGWYTEDGTEVTK